MEKTGLVPFEFRIAGYVSNRERPHPYPLPQTYLPAAALVCDGQLHRQSGMVDTQPAFRDFLDALLQQQALPVDKYGHQPRLYALTRMVGAGLDYDEDVVFAAAYLHDLGVFIGHRPEEPEQLSRWNHVMYTLAKAPGLLEEAGFPLGKVQAVLDAIRTHQPHDDPATLEATILRDADILEQLGAIGILRAVAKVGRDTRYPTFTPAIAFLERNLAALPSQIRLDTTRRIAEPRIALLRAFLDGVTAEACGHLH